MSGMCSALLGDRAVLYIRGSDSAKFLQGLATNDIHSLACPHDALYTAFLSPKGRVKFDAFVSISSTADTPLDKPTFIIDCPQAVISDVKKYFKRHKLRSDVQLEHSKEHAVWSIMLDGDVNDTPIVEPAESLFIDPRCDSMGFRAILPNSSAAGIGENVNSDVYTKLRIAHGIAEATELEGKVPFECNLDFLNAISFNKGCYVGQELTARTQFKGHVRKRYFPVHFSQDLCSEEPACHSPEIGSKIKLEATGKRVGSVVATCSGVNIGIALLRLEHIFSDSLPQRFEVPASTPSGDEQLGVTPQMPVWMPALDLGTGKALE